MVKHKRLANCTHPNWSNTLLNAYYIPINASKTLPYKGISF